ncbi:hypothetical protein HDU67_001657 [Dinochytrium kinnereticum]|nr:hypothetical protein HDU67_001657 [Dinochytrium kinnereticum]
MADTKGDGNDEATLPLTNDIPKEAPPANNIHPAVYITIWIFFSSATILFNKWILHTLNFPYPIFLTTCHLIFATIATRILSQTTGMLNGIHDVKMNWEVYMKAVVPIGLCFSLSLVFSNYAYLYLSVAYIQMLKATTPVAVLFAGYLLRVEKYDPVILGKVSIIVLGVMLASYGEFEFVLLGVILQSLGIAAEATRLVLVQQLLKGYNMDPLVSLYYFAPICAAINAAAFVFVESSEFSMAALQGVGAPVLLINCMVAFLLNVAVVFLIGKTSSLVMCLSGVLKDIILVVASVLIWWTTVTRLQMVGYSTALAGLVWYKQPNIDRRRLLIGWAAMVILIGLTALQDVNWNSASFTPSYTSKVFSTVKSTSGLDTSVGIVISHIDEDKTVLANMVKAVRDVEYIKKHLGTVTVFIRQNDTDAAALKTLLKADDVITLAPTGGHADAYLHYISSRYSELPDKIMFLHGDASGFLQSPYDSSELTRSMSTRLKQLDAATGFMPLGRTSVRRSDDGEFSKSHVREIYSMVHLKVAPPHFTFTDDSQFIVSSKRIRLTPQKVFTHLSEMLEVPQDHYLQSGHHLGFKNQSLPEDIALAHSVDSSYGILFHCWDSTLHDGCSGEDQSCKCEDARLVRRYSDYVLAE